MMAKDRAAWRAKKEAEADLREHLRDHRNSFAGLEGNPSPLFPAAIFARVALAESGADGLRHDGRGRPSRVVIQPWREGSTPSGGAGAGAGAG